MFKNLSHTFFTNFGILFLLLCIPLNYGYSNFALIILVLTAFIFVKKNKVTYNLGLYLPMLLYSIMVISCFWSINKDATQAALLKEISILLIPLAFLLFGKIEEENSKKIFLIYTWGIVIYCFLFLANAFYKYLNTHDSSFFYYHNLVSKDLNAIHFSVFVTVAIFILLDLNIKKWFHYLTLLFLGFTLFLLSSKTVIISFLLLITIHEIFYSKNAQRLRLRNIIIFGLILISLFFIGTVKDRFKAEIEANTTKSISHNVIEPTPSSVNIISMKEAWNNENFTANDYFPGSAFRVFQTRVFYELMQENNVFFTGFGLEASQKKIEEKTLGYQLYSGDANHEGYQKKNFHNQYIQFFSELGLFGFLILIIMIVYSIKIALKEKNFVFFATIILLGIVFLTESFLGRQRGVLFFMTLYCLLHQINFKKSLTTAQ